MLDFNDLPVKDKIYYQDSACVVYCSEKYCEIAKNRLAQSVMSLEIVKEEIKTEALL